MDDQHEKSGLQLDVFCNVRTEPCAQVSLACLYALVPLGGPAWGNIPPLEDEVNEFLEKTNLKSLSAARAGVGAQLPEATTPMAVARSTGVRAAGGVRQEPSQPPPQFMKRSSSGAGPVSPAAVGMAPGRSPASGDVSERRRSIQMTAGSLAVRVHFATPLCRAANN